MLVLLFFLPIIFLFVRLYGVDVTQSSRWLDVMMRVLASLWMVPIVGLFIVGASGNDDAFSFFISIIGGGYSLILFLLIFGIDLFVVIAPQTWMKRFK